MNSNIEDTPEAVSDIARAEKVSELEILQQSLEEKKRLADDYYHQLLRLKADFENYRKRAEKEKHNHLLWGKEEILLKQIRLLDVMEQAQATAVDGANLESIKTGMNLIHQEFKKILSEEGVTEMECKGGAFDPTLHEAVEQIENEQPEGTIIEVIQKGYQIGNRMVRPARVKVSKGKKANADNCDK